MCWLLGFNSISSNFCYCFEKTQFAVFLLYSLVRSIFFDCYRENLDLVRVVLLFETFRCSFQVSNEISSLFAELTRFLLLYYERERKKRRKSTTIVKSDLKSKFRQESNDWHENFTDSSHFRQLFTIIDLLWNQLTKRSLNSTSWLNIWE